MQEKTALEAVLAMKTRNLKCFLLVLSGESFDVLLKYVLRLNNEYIEKWQSLHRHNVSERHCDYRPYLIFHYCQA